MSNIIDRQTVVISISCINFSTVTNIASQITLPMNLRFAADCLVLKNISYAEPNNTDINDVVQIWCNITNDNLIGSFSNGGPNSISQDTHHFDFFRINNTFQNGNLVLQLQGTDSGNPASGIIGNYNPQPLISTQNPQRTSGTVVLTIEFIKLRDKSIY